MAIAVETVAAARARYFATNGFTEAAYRDRWAKLKIGPIPLAFPNTASRQQALPMHDLHHIATGYATTLTGEAEIGAFEVGGGCGRYGAAWVLNLAGLGYGVLIAPRRIWRAFVRGRHSTNLYQRGWRDDLLALTVDELRTHLQIDTPVKATGRDRVAFLGWLALLGLPWIGAALLVLRLW